MKIAIFSMHAFEKPYLEKYADVGYECVFINEKLSVKTAHLAAGCRAVVLFTSDDASTRVLEILAAEKVELVALRSVGYDHVDLEKAQSLGLKVANVPEYSPYSVAEHAVALLMALNRKILLSQKLIDEGDFQLNGLTGMDIHGKTIGIIGTGKIGTAFARIMHGFGTRLLGYDICQNEELIEVTGIRYVDLPTLAAQSDIISIHCPLNGQSRYMINADLFKTMKKGVILLNTARGGIINTLDLIEALDQKIIGSAGLDVYEYEKAFFFSDQRTSPTTDPLFDKLCSYPNVLVTGHQSFLTQEALGSIAQTTLNNLTEWEKTGKAANDLF